ncbi:MAG: hypothetical protein JWR19_2320 [Pedosphaera sp.]|nr:hypothetical protein [Pedosphaera sp.]
MLKFTPLNKSYIASPLWFGALVFAIVAFTFGADAATAQGGKVFITASAPALDAKHLYALGMLETGNNDEEVGGAGEISRYQIHPAVWKSYSASHDYNNPEISLQVARLHWNYLASYFRERAGRQPTDYDMYVLWNTTFGYYARRGFSSNRISPIVQDRAQRFVNLVNRKD